MDGTHNPLPSSITGIPDNYVENITLERINIIMPGRASRVVSYMPLNRLDNVLELIKSYPGFSMFRDLPAWDFYIQHVKGITLKNVRFSLYEDDFRPAFIFDDVEKISIYNLSLPLGKKEEEQIIIR